ncbi:hypothetical protein, partial [Paracoccus lutimaris]|uniref:hypothetical protein n=1 Tax=Paracoccus lutimaris TaxID=1490030 RepID=UPI001C69A21D
HISSDISQCQKAGETKQPEPRHFLRGAVKPSNFPIFPELTTVSSASFRPVSAFRRFGEQVSRPRRRDPQERKFIKMTKTCNSL